MYTVVMCGCLSVCIINQSQGEINQTLGSLTFERTTWLRRQFTVEVWIQRLLVWTRRLVENTDYDHLYDELCKRCTTEGDLMKICLKTNAGNVQCVCTVTSFHAAGDETKCRNNEMNTHFFTLLSCFRGQEASTESEKLFLRAAGSQNKWNTFFWNVTHGWRTSTAWICMKLCWLNHRSLRLTTALKMYASLIKCWRCI